MGLKILERDQRPGYGAIIIEFMKQKLLFLQLLMYSEEMFVLLKSGIVEREHSSLN